MSARVPRIFARVCSVLPLPLLITPTKVKPPAAVLVAPAGGLLYPSLASRLPLPSPKACAFTLLSPSLKVPASSVARPERIPQCTLRQIAEKNLL